MKKKVMKEMWMMRKKGNSEEGEKESESWRRGSKDRQVTLGEEDGEKRRVTVRGKDGEKER